MASDEVHDQPDQPDEADGPAESAPTASADVKRWEWWARLSIVLFGVMAACWGLVFLRWGIVSVEIQATVIPTLGAVTIPFLVMGLMRTLLRPPAFRRSRTIAFLALVATGYVGNVPLVAVPLASEGWQSEHIYHLPFNGKWMTLAGGSQPARNYHATTAAARWGYDFTVMEKGKKFRLDGKKNTDWYCWGKAVFAPTDGKVVLISDHVPDNEPGEISADSVLGNRVVIEAGPHEFVFVSNLQHHSIHLKPGQHVTTATVIGACGNSGRTVEPSVHVHAQDRLEFPIALGLPMKFSGYKADGKFVKIGMPLGTTDWNKPNGQVVENLAPR